MANDVQLLQEAYNKILTENEGSQNEVLKAVNQLILKAYGITSYIPNTPVYQNPELLSAIQDLVSKVDLIAQKLYEQGEQNR